MTNKHSTGGYLVYFYDRFGTKQETAPAESFTQAEAVGDKGISQPPYASYVIVRVLKNSLDTAYPWSNHAQSPQSEIKEEVPSAEIADCTFTSEK